MARQTYIKWLPVFNKDLCTACRLCLEVCPSGCLVILNDLATLVSPEKCHSDGLCSEACPTQGIHMNWRALEGDRNIGCWRALTPDFPGATD